MNHIQKIAAEFSLQLWQVTNVVSLLDEGATIPFLARYRKEKTGTLDEVAISSIRDRISQLRELDKRRDAILESIKEQGLLTPELEQKIAHAETMSILEDLYLPFKPKRKTKATVAKAKGLEPLAKIIFNQAPGDIEGKAEAYISDEKGVGNTDEALAGARDIIAEWVSEHDVARSRMRQLFEREAFISSKVMRGKKEEGLKYENWFEFSEPLSKAPSHRILAMLRGSDEGILKIKVEPEEQRAIDQLDRLFVKGSTPAAQQVKKAIADSYDRLLQPSMETESLQKAKERADLEAIKVFAENIRQLLLSPPLGEKNVLAIDPGFRTGCKVVCLDKNGNLLHNETIYPHPPQSEFKQAMAKIQNLVTSYKIEAIAIGNGTAGRETEFFIQKIPFSREVIALMVNESGASVYSASSVAREEFPEYDITVRGAVSIGRRLMDPLAELVKIDPKSIGVGQYQHDVNQNLLKKSLEDTVVSCVNAVGVELNTASKELLTHVSGLGPVLAKNIIDYRTKNGGFTSRKELLKVTRFGEKAFEQAAGFIRIRDAVNPLDQSAVHPEAYHVVEKMVKKLGCTISELMSSEELRKRLKLEEFITETIGLPTLTDIMLELSKPGRDPRKKFDIFEFDKSVRNIDDVVVGMVLPGIITNITAFGAFVDIGVHQDGLVHISQMTDRFIKDPNEAVSLNMKVQVKVLEVDKARKRISLSMKNI
ncbi:MAG: RNA-binding transcriptional accessory protein [Bacteroidetes bacterium]|nr:RNA-binding transcriptional accessory protein [Bacteroidota bacterium]